MTSVLGMSFEYLDALPAQQVPLYGIASLEHQATELRRSCELFMLPAEAIGGGKGTTLKRLNEEISRMGGAMAPEQLDNPFAELDRKYLRDLADAAKIGNFELVDHLERLYAMEAADISRRRDEEIRERVSDVKINMDPRVFELLKAKAQRQAETI